MTSRTRKSQWAFYAVILVLTGSLAYTYGQRSAPRGATVRLENERVRVVEYVLLPGVAMGMHNHPRDRVEINLTGSRVRVTQANGRTMESDEKEGAITWSKAATEMHDVVNIGKAPLRSIQVELK